MTEILSGVLAASGLLVWVGDRPLVARRRVIALRGAPQPGWSFLAGLSMADLRPRHAASRVPLRRPGPARPRARLTVAAAFSAVTGWLAGGGSWAAVAAASAWGAGWVIAGREAAATRATRAAETAALPGAADLLAICLTAGGSPVDSLRLVAEAVGPPLQSRLEQVSAALSLGADADGAWASADDNDPLVALRRAYARASATGAPLADTVAGVAEDQRQRRRWTAQAAARRAGVLAVGPLVLCFLPAFVLLGVVPIVVGIAGEVLGDLR